MLTDDDYVAAGRVQGAIAKTAETVYNDLDEQEQTQARRIFLQLTELGEGREDTRRRVPTNTLRQTLHVEPEHRDLLTYLADRRLIITDNHNAEVTHEALIREWQRLRTWLDNNRDALRLQRKINTDAQEWFDHNKSSDFLYRGLPLDRATEWLTTNESEATTIERQFLDSGLDNHKQQQTVNEAIKQRELEATRQVAAANQEIAEKAQALAKAQQSIAHEATVRSIRSRRWLGLALFLLATAIILGLVANGARITANRAEATAEVDAQHAKSQATTAAINLQIAEEAQNMAEAQRTEAQRLAKVSLAQSLAALSSNVASDAFGNQDEIGILLAIEAMRLNIEQQGTLGWLIDQSLRNLLTTPFQSKILQPPKPYITSIAFSPDGNIVVTGTHASVNSVAFSPDGNTLASGSDDQTIRLWLPKLEQLAEIDCNSVRRNLAWEEWQRYLPAEATYNQTCANLRIHPSVPEEARP